MSREYHQSVYAPPPGAADLLLIRHGRTEAARPGQSFAMKDGHGDPALHPEGERQARAVADAHRRAHLDLASSVQGEGRVVVQVHK